MTAFTLPTRAPFVLLEDRLTPGAPARLYRDPVEIVQCNEPDEIDPAFARIEAGLANGLHAAGVCAYELGYALEPRLARLIPATRDAPLLWFGLFVAPALVPPEALDEAFAALGPPVPIAAPTPDWDAPTHAAKVRQVQALVAAGDIYQANLTFPIHFSGCPDPLKLYAAMRARQPTAHGGVVMLEDHAILSVSPELWVEATGGQLTTRPMKGTAARHADPAADAEAKAVLRADPKQRAENLMITDLLRNDLSRIAEAGSVHTPALLTVETYPTFHALTSTVTGTLRPGVSLKDRFQALFPCGSIVGAPKIRAAEIIADLETTPRGVYTGAIGDLHPGGDMRFNVAIRTAVVRPDGSGLYGVGGGIVADSQDQAEYAEALLKARALTNLASDYQLIETFRWRFGEGFIRLMRHLDRMGASARQLGFAFDRMATETKLHAAASGWTGEADRRVRLVLARDGSITIEGPKLPAPLDRPMRVVLATQVLDSGDPFLRHKTTRRDAYEAAFAEAAAQGCDEALLLNRRGEIVEASRNTVFVRIGTRLITPPLSAGALPGVLRQDLLDRGEAEEGALTLGDLNRAEIWFLGNSLRGLREARLAELDAGAF